jgi:geranylgeranyl pyrophosphate synthase
VADAAEVIAQLGLDAEVRSLRDQLTAWIARADEEMRDALHWQFQGGSKYFRPLTIFSCYRAIYRGPTPPELVRSATVLEMFHNVSLIVDDILDRSQYRRGVLTLHAKFGMLSALMTSGYIVADGYRLVRDDPHDIALLAELLKRLGVAECLQWRLRRQPLGVDDWRHIAEEDTGTMFEVCACLGTRTEELRRFGRLLGLLYHGCDVRGAEALGGGGEEDLRDGILTLPAAFAIADAHVAAIFCNTNPSDADLRALGAAFRETLPRAEAYLDGIAEEARQEARRFAPRPEPLLALIEQTRQLSRR